MSATAAGWHVGMAWLLAWRNLTHDGARFLVTLVGIVFAVVLIGVQSGLFIGFTDATTNIIRHTRADFWVLATGSQNFEVAQPIHERERFLALSVPGVARVETLLVQFGNWQKPQGGVESVLILGFDLNSGLAGPWNVVAGHREDLRLPDAIMIDEIFAAKLGVSGVGETVDINGRRARIVGLTRGIRSFTTSPWVFASYPTARHLSGFPEDTTNYVIGTFVVGADPRAVRTELQERLPRTDVLLSEEFRRQTRDYWMYTTGAGVSVLLSAFLGLVVGMVIVAQVLYATTMDHLPEFGTLSAMGAPRAFIYKVILGQAVISAILGYLPGIVIVLLVSHAADTSAANIPVPPELAATLFAVTLAMCVAASFVSIRKAMSIDPAMVFQR